MQMTRSMAREMLAHARDGRNSHVRRLKEGRFMAGALERQFQQTFRATALGDEALGESGAR